jgi:ketosteroid isomerase-like protein
MPVIEAAGITDDADQVAQAGAAVETLLALYDDEIEFKMIWAVKPSHGHVGVVQAIGEWMALMGEWRWQINDFIDVGDTVVVDLVTQQIGASSGARTQERIFVALTMRDGKICRHWEYPDLGEALQAAGQRLGSAD